MATLVVCPAPTADPKPILACVTAAQQLADPAVDVLCIQPQALGPDDVACVAAVAARTAGVRQVLIASDAALSDGLAEPCAAMLHDVMQR